MNYHCHLCGRPSVAPLIDFGSHPIVHHFLSTPDQSEYTHRVVLGFCGSCGLSQLIDPIPPAKLYTEYNWLTSSKWNPHVPRLVQMIDQCSGLTRDSVVLEAGCNDGSFLDELRKHGFRRLLGLEPAEDAVAAARRRGVEVVRAYFTPASARDVVASFGQCDLFVSRQVVEHVTALQEFAEAIRVVLRPGAHVLLEVPDFGFTQDTRDYGAIWEEHVNHFTLGTLRRFMAEAGIELVHSETAVFSGQALIVLGRYTGIVGDGGHPTTVAELRAKALAFRDQWPRFRQAFHHFFEEKGLGGRKVAAYGAGCRSCCLINYTGMKPYLDFVVDDQMEKQGKFVPGSRLKILPGEALVGEAVGLCLLGVNAENEEKVIGRNSAFIAQGGEFVSIHPPSPLLPTFWNRL